MRRARLLLALLVAVLGGAFLAPVARSLGDPGTRPVTTSSPSRPGAAQLAAAVEAAEPAATLRAIATFGGRTPTGPQVAALRDLGLAVQPLERLPLALLSGTAAQLQAVLDRGLAADVYPDEQLEWHWTTSNKTMTADAAQALGFTGEGVTVAVIDSGIDGTHDDLADHVSHNVKLLGGEYVNQYPTPEAEDASYVVVPFDEGPYNNSDIGSGHGTHVAGIIAADGTTDPEQTGVAPDAELVGYSIGEVAFTTAVVTAFDHILDNPDWGIDVVNNSWGNSWHWFDPEHPLNVATKAVADSGVVIVFSAGNNGDGDTEMTLNPWSMAPWVISVASGTVSGERSSFSSNGLAMDNSLPVGLEEGEDGVRHRRFEGDRVGFAAPDITAPGSDIVSSATPTGAYLGPTRPGGTASASGTSMSGPHIAGAAAVLLSANPDLTPEQVRMALTATARPMKDGTPYWRAGYGYADLAAAVELVRRPSFPRAIVNAQRKADARVLADRDWKVLASDIWSFDASRLTVGGQPDSESFGFEVPAAAQGVKLTLGYPTVQGTLNYSTYDLVVTDGAGEPVEVEPVVSGGSGTTSALIDLRETKAAPGTWTVEVAGQLAASDPDTLDSDSISGRKVELQAATLVAQARKTVETGPVFVAGDQSTIFFRPDGASGLPDADGCGADEGAPSGGLGSAPLDPEAGCESGMVGYAVNYGAGVPATFTSEPLPNDRTFGGAGNLLLHLSGPGAGGFLDWAVESIGPDDEATQLAAGTVEGAVAAPAAGTIDAPLEMAPFTVPKGHRMRVSITLSAVANSAVRLLYGTGFESAITLTNGSFR